jgi:L-ribulokinase
VAEAGNAMGRVTRGAYQPNPEASDAYDALFAEYTLLHDYFGRGANDVMKRLKTMRREVLT